MIFIPRYCYSRHYNKVWWVNLTWDKPKTDWIEYMNRIIIIWNPTYSLGRVGGSPIALRVGQSEVNGTMRASVSYYIYLFAYHSLIPRDDIYNSDGTWIVSYADVLGVRHAFMLICLWGYPGPGMHGLVESFFHCWTNIILCNSEV